MTTKHTPGPWKVDEAEDLPLAVIEDTADGHGIAELGERNPCSVANARLIAAAPDLLAALEQIAAVYPKTAEAEKLAAIAHAAIAKATQ